MERFDLLGPLPTERSTTVLEASAGTGKTFALAGLVTRSVAEGGIDGLGQSAANARGRFQAIDDDFDVVPHLAIERESVVERHVFAIDADGHVAARPRHPATLPVPLLLTELVGHLPLADAVVDLLYGGGEP